MSENSPAVRGRGRPRGTGKAAEDRRRNLGVQVSPKERAVLQAAADATGKPLSVFIRDAALEAAKCHKQP